MLGLTLLFSLQSLEVLKATISRRWSNQATSGATSFQSASESHTVCAIAHHSCFQKMDVPKWCCELAVEYHVTPMETHILIVGNDNGTACYFTLSIIMQYQTNFGFTILCGG